MKRADLEVLGLEKEVVDKIMAMNGTDIEAEKTKFTDELESYKGQLATAKEQLDKFKDVDPQELNSTIEKLKKDLADQAANFEAEKANALFNDSVKEAIKGLGGRNDKAIMAMLDLDALKASKNQTEDIKKALDAVKESDAYLFGKDEPINNFVGGTGGSGGEDVSLSAIRSAMGLPAEK